MWSRKWEVCEPWLLLFFRGTGLEVFDHFICVTVAGVEIFWEFTDILVSFHMECCHCCFEEAGEVIWIIELWFPAVMVCTAREKGEGFLETARFGRVFWFETEMPFPRHEGVVSGFFEEFGESNDILS